MTRGLAIICSLFCSLKLDSYASRQITSAAGWGSQVLLLRPRHRESVDPGFRASPQYKPCPPGFFQRRATTSHSFSADLRSVSNTRLGYTDQITHFPDRLCQTDSVIFNRLAEAAGHDKLNRRVSDSHTFNVQGSRFHPSPFPFAFILVDSFVAPFSRFKDSRLCPVGPIFNR